jgi:hypothetical protein
VCAVPRGSISLLWRRDRLTPSMSTLSTNMYCVGVMERDHALPLQRCTDDPLSSFIRFAAFCGR